MKSVLFAIIILVSGVCVAQPKTKASVSGVELYYFHATNRCATCEAVENVTREALQQYYGNQVAFTAVNRDQEKDHPLIAKHKVSGQTLLVVKGDKSVNLTNVAFMNARTKPEKLKEKIKETVDKM